MAGKRKDGKWRNLKDGETQMPDGRYRFRYQDRNGKRQAVYSWRLVSTDRTPAGKRESLSLREKEAAIAADSRDGIDTRTAGKTTIAGMFSRYMESKRDLKEHTIFIYHEIFKRYISGQIGNMKLSDVRFSDMKRFYNSLVDAGLSVESVGFVNKILHPLFELAIRDGVIRTNPTSGIMRELKANAGNGVKKRHALTIAEQAAFVDFIAASNRFRHWLPLFTFMLGTGCRVGETIGLTWNDCDMESGVISINHALIYKPLRGVHEFHASSPKTAKGCRTIPMLQDVKAALEEQREQQKQERIPAVKIDGYAGFVFTSNSGFPLAPTNINRTIKRIYTAYNKQESARAQQEQRDPVLIRPFSAHDLRHTFCTRFCENETNVKVIQEIMGHSDIKITMDIYAEVTEIKKQETLANLEGKIKIR